MKPRYPMTLLIACILNGNSEVLPIVWAVVSPDMPDNLGLHDVWRRRFLP